MKVKISDYIMDFIAGLGVRQVFYMAGGGAMHLNDSLGRSKYLEGVCMLHEQGAAIAAEAYARIQEGYGACLVTSGPGATNALTGLAGAYMDSIPVIFLSGQVKRADLVGEQGIRQFGIQEVNIISMAESYTKYAVQIREPEEIRYELEKAAAIAVNGRPGPVWIDVPLDIQAMQVETEELQGFSGEGLGEYPAKEEEITRTIELLNQAERPVLLLGHGIRLGHAVEEAREFYHVLGIPVLTSWNGVDLIEEEHPLYFGRPGSVGHRAANLIQQSADFVLTIGSRLNLLSTGYNYESFLARANHVMVDIDEKEMNKKSVHPQLKVVCDAKAFLKAMLARKSEIEKPDRSSWLQRCEQLFRKYPVRIPEQEAREGFVSSYRLIQEVSDQMTGEDIYQFTSSGTTVDIAMKVFEIKAGQRAFLTKGLAAMGYDIPACIGSCIASGNRRTVCVTGDGSAAMNMQELEVIRRRQLPVKIFVADNQGYSMIYGSQNGNFKGHLTGCTEESGLTLPDMRAVAEAFGIKGMHIENEEHLKEQVAEVLNEPGPVVCTYQADITQKILPRQTSYMREDGQMASRPLEDMTPLLEREELEEILG
ncbi:MAG: thiamine pyrophosphate-binding protein [Lachnospiraceae bacterium]|nr:thiamine pyrophosphate-binding protein [Lachnospiraceae bacterium]